MKIDEEALDLLNQYADEFAAARYAAAIDGRTLDVAIHDAQLDLALHLIEVFELVQSE